MGLQPSLYLVTRPDGVIYTRSEVNNFSSVNSKSFTQFAKKRRRSGHGARLCRQLQRSENAKLSNNIDILTYGTTDDVTTNTIVLSNEDFDSAADDSQPFKPTPRCL